MNISEKSKVNNAIGEVIDDVDESPTSFIKLGINDELCAACERVGWTKPTRIQQGVIPTALDGRDVIGLAETGSGKTGAFALPILHSLMENPQRLYALILAPTRELAFQISEHFEALGSTIGLIVSTIVGGIDMAAQTISLSKRPHVIVATPGRLVDHLENTKGFNLKSIKYVVMDEADRILNMDFEIELEKILRVVPKNRRTFLFSATMTNKVSKLERACLQNPFRVEVSSKYQTVDALKQNLLFVPQKYKEAYLVYLLNDRAANTIIVFCGTCASVVKISLMLQQLGMSAVALHGQMIQSKRLGALGKFKAKNRAILVCTDVASRGLDIPHVDVVVNYDVPTNPKDYVHRVGRTARAGRTGLAVTIVTQYDVEIYQKIEQSIEKKLDPIKLNHEDVLQIVDRVSEAGRYAANRYKELGEKKGRRSSAVDDDDGTVVLKRRKLIKNK